MPNHPQTLIVPTRRSGLHFAVDGKDPVDVHVGSRLRLARMATGLTQGKVGKALGISTQQVQKYEKGVNRLGAGKLYRLAGMLDVSVEFFFRDLPSEISSEGDIDVDDSVPVSNRGHKGGDREVLRLVTAFLNIKDRELRGEIVSLVVAMRRSKADV